MVPGKEPPTYPPVLAAKKKNAWGSDSWVLKEEGMGGWPCFWAGGGGRRVDSRVRAKKQLGGPGSWVLGTPQLELRIVEFG